MLYIYVCTYHMCEKAKSNLSASNKILQETWVFLSGWQGVKWHCMLSLMGTWVLGHWIQMPSVGKPGTCKRLDIALNDNGWSIPDSLRSASLAAFNSLDFSPLWKIVLYLGKNTNYLLRNHLRKANTLGLSQGKAWLKCQASLAWISGHCCLFTWCYLTYIC